MLRFVREVTRITTTTSLAAAALRLTALSSGLALLSSLNRKRIIRGEGDWAHLYVGQTVTPGAVAGLTRRLTDLPARQVILEVAGGDSQEVHTSRVVRLQSEGGSVVMDGPGHVSL